MKKFIKYMPLLLALFLASCATDLKKANELYGQKNYEEALKMFEGILQKDPKNEDAQLGLRKSREGVIDKDLIRIRLMRLGGNPQEALEILRKTYAQQNEWKLFPSGAVAFTQKEETELAITQLKKDIHSALSQKQNLRASYLLQRYSNIVDDQRKAEMTGFEVDAAKQGRVFCLAERKKQSSQVPFYSEFIDKYCLFYKVPGQQKPWNKNLFSDLKFTTTVAQFDLENPKKVEADLQSTFQKTAWYDANSKKGLPVQLKTKFEFSHLKSSHYETLYYNESVPYTDYETQAVTNETGVVEHKSVPVTKYKNEPRNMQYVVIDHDLHTQIEVGADIPFAENTLNYLFTSSAAGSGREQPISNSTVGLYPTKPTNIRSSADFYAQFMAEAAAKFKDDLIKKYVALFCENVGNQTDLIKKADFAFKCLRQTQSHAQMNSYMDQAFSLQPWQVAEVIP